MGQKIKKMSPIMKKSVLYIQGELQKHSEVGSTTAGGSSSANVPMQNMGKTKGRNGNMG